MAIPELRCFLHNFMSAPESVIQFCTGPKNQVNTDSADLLTLYPLSVFLLTICLLHSFLLTLSSALKRTLPDPAILS